MGNREPNGVAGLGLGRDDGDREGNVMMYPGAVLMYRLYLRTASKVGEMVLVVLVVLKWM